MADLRVGELSDIIHAPAILLPLGSEVQHLVAFHLGLALQSDIAQVVGDFEGVWRCVCAMSLLTLCRRCTLRWAAVCLLLSLHISPSGFVSLLGWVGELFLTSMKHTCNKSSPSGLSFWLGVVAIHYIREAHMKQKDHRGSG